MSCHIFILCDNLAKCKMEKCLTNSPIEDIVENVMKQYTCMYVGGVNAKLQPCTSNLHVSVAAFNLVCVVGIHLAFGQITY